MLLRTYKVILLIFGILILYGCGPQVKDNGDKAIEFGKFEDRPQRQHTFFENGSLITPCYSKSDNSIYFSSNYREGIFSIYKTGLTGTTITEVLNKDVNIAFPSISPNGKYMAYCSAENDNWDIEVIILETGKRADYFSITNSSSDEIHPSWSYDGNYITFSKFSTLRSKWEIILYDVKTKIQTNTGIRGLFPSFHPSSNILAFQAPSSDNDSWYGIWTYDIKTHVLSQLIYNEHWAAINPIWSDDGKKIFFATVNKAPGKEISGHLMISYDIWTLDIKTEKIGQLTFNDNIEWYPFYGSGRVFFISKRSGKDNIWSIEDSAKLILEKKPRY